MTGRRLHTHLKKKEVDVILVKKNFPAGAFLRDSSPQRLDVPAQDQNTSLTAFHDKEKIDTEGQQDPPATLSFTV